MLVLQQDDLQVLLESFAQFKKTDGIGSSGDPSLPTDDVLQDIDLHDEISRSTEQRETTAEQSLLCFDATEFKKRNAKSGGTKSAADGDMEDERGQGRTVPDHFDIFDVSYQMIGHYVDVHSGTHNTMYLYSFKFLVKSCKYT